MIHRILFECTSQISLLHTIHLKRPLLGRPLTLFEVYRLETSH